MSQASSPPRGAEAEAQEKDQGALAKLSVAFTHWAERWFPDAFVFVILGVLIVAIANLATGASPMKIANGFGQGFWTLIPFTMQMAMVTITGYVVATSPPCTRLIRWLAAIPSSGRGAVAWAAFVTMAASYISYALSLVLGGLLVRALARRTELRMDYRAAGAAAYLGLGATWALGLSSSAAMLQANPASLPKAISDISGVMPLTDTIFLWESIVMLLVIAGVSILIAFLTAPSGKHARTAQEMGIDVSEEAAVTEKADRPGDWCEFTPILPIVIGLIALGYLWLMVSTQGLMQVISNLNNYNFIFLIAGLVLHKTIRSFLRSLVHAVPTAAGVLIQFPFYGSIAAMITAVPGSDGITISHHLSQFFVGIATTGTFPVVIGIYSAVLGFFVPSGGGKWIVEAPYVLEAAKTLHAHMGWAVEVYNAAEAVPNLINPFWALPLLAVLALKARDIIGFCFMQFIVHVPMVLFLLWLLAPAAKM